MPAKGARSTSAEPEARRARPFERVHMLVRRIPRGRVMTYGQISRLLRGRLSAAAVGWAMHGCPDEVPWQRVVNASGGCSTDGLGPHPPGWQRALLEAEGVAFRANGTLDLDRYRWTPRRGAAANAVPARAKEPAVPPCAHRSVASRRSRAR